MTDQATFSLNRRDFLAASGSALALGAMASHGPAIASTPKRGGRLRVAIPGSGNRETLDFNKTMDNISDARILALYEGLTKLERDGSVSNNLAEELTPNADATVWTAKLLPDVLFHNGKELTADDVVYSFQYILDESNKSLAQSQLSAVDPQKIRKLDERTVEIGLVRPNAFFPQFIAEHRVRIVPEGTLEFEPAPGTGPFKFASWVPGERSLFVRNSEYRIHDGPYIEELEYISIEDPSARLNALFGGQVDAIAFVDAAQAPAVEANDQFVLLESEGMEHTPLVMQTDQPPFDDPRVRKAFRLMANREQTIQSALGGRGRIGNDLQSWADPNYAAAIAQRPHDPEQANALLKEAGQEGLSVTLHTSDASGGMLESAVVFAEQAKAAGVSIELKRYPADQFWSTAWMQQPFFSTDWSGRLLVPQFFMAMTPDAPFHETRWNDKKWFDQLDGVLAETDPALQQEMLFDLQEVLFDEGGYVVWGFRSTLDAYRSGIIGIEPSVFKALGGGDYLDVYFET